MGTADKRRNEMSKEVRTGGLQLVDEGMGVGVGYEPGIDKMRVDVWFLVDSMAWEMTPEADPVLGALRMAEEVVSRLKAEAFNRQLKGGVRA
jgi:hypothetical protein